MPHHVITIAKIVAAAMLAATPAVPTEQPASSAGSGSMWPVAPVVVLREFDAVEDPYGPGHRGVDLAAALGQTVVSPLPGVVRFAGNVAGRPVVVIEHPGGIRTTYLPVLASVTVGEDVNSGATLGTLAESSHCGAVPCLHWGAREGGTYIDPRTLIDAAARIRLLPLTND